jgi:hypothetical protein
MKSCYLLISFLLFNYLFGIPIVGNVKAVIDTDNIEQIVKLINANKSDRIFICGSNGIAAEMPADQIKQIEFRVSGDTISAYSEFLPPVCSIRDIRFIAIDGRYAGNNLSVMDKYEQNEYFSPYDFLIKNSDKLGKSAKNGIEVTKYQYHDSISLSTGENTILVSVKGKEIRLNGSQKVNFKLNCFTFEADTLAAIWNNAPEVSLSDIYKMQRDGAEEGRLLAIFVDGLGYQILQNYCSVKQISIEDTGFKPSRSVYPSRTLYASYTLGSGEYYKPGISGMIYTDSVFSGGIIIEESKIYHNSPVMTVLNHDLNESGTYDDEIFKRAKKELKRDFLMVHFHSVDDFSHKYGPFHSETIKQIDKVLEYVEYLSKKYKGDVVIFSDHGQHRVQNGGDHGSSLASDMTGVYKYVEK